MIVDAPAEFWDWVDALEHEADQGDMLSRDRLDLVQALLEELDELDYAPTMDEETATLKWVRQSRRYLVWRISHPYTEGIAVRLIC